MAQTAACAHDDYIAAGLGVCLAQRRVHCQSCAEQWSSRGRVETVRNGSDVVSRSKDILLERARSVVTRDSLHPTLAIAFLTWDFT